jgi:hypothetical protein
MSILNKLTEGIVNRDLSKDGAALRDKWERTGLLEGMGNDRKKDGMSVLLENQAKELLREASTMAAGDVEGFAAVAFPIVRRVFGGLVANELVSVQPMSLPSGLIFFLDFQFNSARAAAGIAANDSVYGGGVVGHQITGGIDLTGGNAESSFYNLNNGYASPTGSAIMGTAVVVVSSGTIGDPLAAPAGTTLLQSEMDTLNELTQYDPDLSGSVVIVFESTGSADLAQLNLKDLVALNWNNSTSAPGRLVRRLTSIASGSTGSDPSASNLRLRFVIQATGTSVLGALDDPIDSDNMLNCLTGTNRHHHTRFVIDDNFVNASGQGRDGVIGAVAGTSVWQLENNEDIPEIDIKVDSVSVTAMTKKLKAKWTPELGQDLNAYHNLDAEVELTSILSEQIALEIDQEILNDLIKGATAGTLYWSRMPGNFVNRETGAGLEQAADSTGFPEFTGTVSEWYETLVETINDVSARIHRKTLRGGANFIVVAPEVANLLEFTSGFRANVTADDTKGTVGAVNTGNLSKKWDVFVDPYFIRNLVLVGRRGSSFLESGFVYAPYVPLQVTPTIFGPEDFVPRKGVMTRYAKKMVRPDMYGLVVVEDLI